MNALVTLRTEHRVIAGLAVNGECGARWSASACDALDTLRTNSTLRTDLTFVAVFTDEKNSGTDRTL